MSRRASRAKLCPTPSKGRHLTEEDAEAMGQRRADEMAMARMPLAALYIYRCDCLWWHLTRQAYGRDGQHRRVA